jgi:hypothetical protein
VCTTERERSSWLIFPSNLLPAARSWVITIATRNRSLSIEGGGDEVHQVLDAVFDRLGLGRQRLA